MVSVGKRHFRIEHPRIHLPKGYAQLEWDFGGATYPLEPNDASEACRRLEFMLESWNEWFAVFEFGCYRRLDWEEKPRTFRDVPSRYAIPPGTREVVSGYELIRRRSIKKDDVEKPVSVDERPYFKDPVPLAFDPDQALWRDDKREHDGVSFKRFWLDPLARTLWLSMRGGYLTSQYFRKDCLIQARSLRRKPPRTVEDLYVSSSLRGNWFSSGLPYWHRVQLYPYVVRCLINEKRWPYFEPPRVPASSLSWVVKRVETI